MNATGGYRIVALAGLALAVVMIVLMKVGTTSGATFVVWGILAVVGAAASAVAVKLDGQARARKVAEERRQRLGEQ